VKLVPQQRQANTAFGDALAAAFEFAATIAVFVGVGFGLDLWLGTLPVLTAVLAVFALTGQTVRMYFSYGAEIERQQSERREGARGGQGLGRIGPGTDGGDL